MRGDLGLTGRHHLGDARPAAFEADEEEAAPILEFDRDQTELGGIEAGIILALRHPDEAAVGGIGPGVIGAGQPLGAARLAVDQARAAVAADVGEGADRAVGGANDEDALAEDVERAPFARRRDVANVQTICQDGRISRAISTRKYSGSR